MGQKNFKFHILLLTLFLYLVIAPFLEKISFAKIVIDIFLTLLLFFAVFTIHGHKIIKTLSVVLLILFLVPLWLASTGVISLSVEFTYLVLIAYIILLICSFVVRFFKARIVDANAIYAALSLYLFIGILWGVIYAFMDFIQPGSFGGTLVQTSGTKDLHTFIYFSYTTLTTLGYGDIFPNTVQAAALCQAEAIIGQFFTSVLIAQLVGIRVTQRLGKGLLD